MATYEDFLARAAENLSRLLRDKVKYLSEVCPPGQVEYHLSKVKDMILAAKSLGVKDLQGLNLDSMPSEDARNFLATVVSMRHLEMREDALWAINSTLKKLGVPEHYYVPASNDEKAEAASSATPAK
jgi:hypothetical protein